ncbi:MAG TPA: hypothetical protein PKX32_06510 [Candidatus Saccharicenans sp.]|jgi:hypothetical protein|nr:hypothetical protein [Candidatus Saccharicenans sp.]
MSESYIGHDIKKIAAAYNWGQANLKKWLDFCTEQGIDWYENLENIKLNLDREQKKNFQGRFNVATYIKDILDNYPKKSR